MEINQLKYFCMVAKHQNISKASRKMYVTQPTLSQSIKRLENELGYDLFDRYGKSITLNSHGMVVQRYAAKILEDIADMERELADVEDTGNTTVSISINTSTKMLTQILPSFRKKYSNIQFIVAQNDYSRPDEDNYDICINSSQGKPVGANEKAILREPLMLAMPKNHRLSALEEVPIRILKNETFVRVAGRDLTEMLQECCRANGFEPRIAFDCDYPSVTMDCVEMGLGIALVPAITWGDLSAKNIVLRPISGINLSRYISISWRSTAYHSQGAKLFCDYFVEYMREHYPDAALEEEEAD